MKKDTKILVTGGLGFIGSNLVDTLVKEGYTNITVIDNLSSLSSNRKYMQPSVRYLLQNVKYMQTHFEYDYKVIFHLAALARIQPSFEQPYKTLDNNIMGTIAIANFARLCKAKLVYAGSSSAYAGIRKSPYAFSKWSGEEVILMYHEVYNLNYNIARFFNVYGNRQPMKGEFAPVIGKFMTQYLVGERLTVVGDGEQKRDFTHVNDICQGLIVMSTLEKQGIYNLGTGLNYTINEIALTFKDDIIHIPERLGEARTSLANISMTEKDFNWVPKWNLINYIESWKIDQQ